jgi:hypothetical protein
MTSGRALALLGNHFLSLERRGLDQGKCYLDHFGKLGAEQKN